MTDIWKELRDEGIDPALLEEIQAFRAQHPAPPEAQSRIPAPHYLYYGKEIWESAAAARTVQRYMPICLRSSASLKFFISIPCGLCLHVEVRPCSSARMLCLCVQRSRYTDFCAQSKRARPQRWGGECICRIFRFVLCGGRFLHTNTGEHNEGIMESLIPPFAAYKGDDPYIFVSYAHKNSEVVFAHITRLHEEGFRSS